MNLFSYSPINQDIFKNFATVPTKDVSKDNFLAGDYQAGSFVDEKFLGSLNLNDPSFFKRTDNIADYLGNNYTANEFITAGYVRYDQKFNEKLLMIAGFRVENTKLTYCGNQVVLDEGGNYDPSQSKLLEKTSSYTNILPSLHFKYDATEKTVLRLAWTNTLARPRYFDLVPYRQISIEDNALSEGNPNLKPTVSMNFDFMAEHYFDNVGIISGGIFQKSIKDFIFVYQNRNHLDPVTNAVFTEYVQARNGGNASLLGFEVAFQRQLDFLPGFLKNFGIYTNYTLTTSRVNGVPLEGRENERFSLPGTAMHTGNASLAYESAKFAARVSLNLTSSYIDELGNSKFNDRYYDKQIFLDFSGYYKFTPNFRFFFEANNLTNQPLRYYQGIRERVMQNEFYNIRLNAGVKFDLTK
jgi:TonB-dependent receptor